MPPYTYTHLRAKPKAKEAYYTTSQYWSDVESIPLIEGPPQPTPKPGEPIPPPPAPALATIAYSPRYLEAMSYLRAVMAANEFSERCLALTEDIIEQNPAHYTVWLFRMKCLRELWGVNTDGPTPSPTPENESKIIPGVDRELEWLESVSERNLKNYQIWHHRQSLLSLLPATHPLPATEVPFITHILSFDAKNYHVWTYRQWLCRRFASELLPPSGSTSPPSPELASLEQLLTEDARNNSAWSHRYFVVFGHEELAELEKPGQKLVRKELLEQGVLKVDEAVVEREIGFAKGWIEVAPQNASPWNYLRGVLKRAGRGLGTVRGFCEGFVRPVGMGGVSVWRDGAAGFDGQPGAAAVADENADLDFEGDGVRSSHAIDWLSLIYMEDGTEEGKEKARRCLNALGSKWDIIRKNYWEYRARSI